MTEQTEARRLIESAFEDTAGSGEDLSRAREAVAAFRAAADAYALGYSSETAMLLSWRIDGADDPALAAHDVAAAGAACVARLLVNRGGENCTGVEITVRGEDVDPIYRAAETFVNVAAAGMLGLLTQMLNRFYDESTLDDLCVLVMALVSIWANTVQRSARYDS